ncbi:LuxR family transcriptional regulator [Rhizocola hellebori]|uniref:LuxR family transcriptional regulator n=1 Tax=Rhizocola hellebori TaxID=1392758 RepID=A0A8J3QHM4_9ACTN|nr:LuxR family transcriptional regulator [Rhizocola hellebori]GIH09578.1 LuxR family transcriptional regulator [Rhizocola hellebori]
MARDWAFAGRDGELAFMNAAFRQPECAALVVTGDAGVGKTALVRAALAAWRRQGLHIEWAAATRTVAAIPFGAVAHLLGPQVDAGPTGLLLSITDYFSALPGRRRVVIGVDDANLLDPASAAAIAHLISAGLAFVVMTLRRDAEVPELAVSLYKQGRAERLELEGLPPQVLDSLIDKYVDGQVDGLSRRRLHDLVRGNPLALREILRGGGLHQRHGVWLLDTSFAVPDQLADLVWHRLQNLDPAARAVLEMVTCGEPVSLSVLERLADFTAIDLAEASGAVVVEPAQARVEAQLAHPLYGEVIRARLSAARARQIYRHLSEAILATPMRRRDDALRAALWQVEGGRVIDAEVVRAGAALAVGRADLVIAERLARAARLAQPSPQADRLLAEILQYRGRDAEATMLLAEQASHDAEPVSWAVTHAENLYWGNGDFAAAERMLAAVFDQPGGDAARGSWSWILFFDGQCERALREALAVRDGQSQLAVVWACASGSAASGFLGDPVVSADFFQRGMRIAREKADELPWAAFEIEIGYCLSNLAMGDLAQAETVTGGGYQAALASGMPMMVAGWALHSGLVAAARGHLDRAAHLLREAVGRLEENDTFHVARCCVGALAWIAGTKGDPEAARRWMHRADELAGRHNRIWEPSLGIWRAWVEYAEGAQLAAVDSARRSAQLANELELPTIEAAARYETIRLGVPAAQCATDRKRLAELAAQLRTPFAQTLATAAEAVAGEDAGALLAAARSFEQLGHDLLAAEAATVATRLWQAAGMRSRHSGALLYASKLRDLCPGARTPLLASDQDFHLLSPREREVAMLATRHSSREVAEQLGLAVTTVNNTLARACTKLGVSGRQGLRVVLGDAAER